MKKQTEKTKTYRPKQSSVKFARFSLRQSMLIFLFICMPLAVALLYSVFAKNSTKPYDYTTAIAFVQNRGAEFKNAIQDATISRARFIEMLMKTAFDEPFEYTKDEDCYKDVTKDAWYRNSICSAKERGILSVEGERWHPSFGHREIYFKPLEPIPFTEALRYAMTAFDYSFSYQDAPWYKDMISKVSEMNIIPLTLTDPEQLLTRGEAADLITRLLNNQINVADETAKKPFFKVTYQTLSQGQNVLGRMELGKESQCFYGGLYYDNGAEFRHINEDNSCSDCTCANGKVTCGSVACEPDPIEEIRPEGQYEFPFQACNPDSYKTVTINILDEWENLEGIKANVDKIRHGRRYVQDILGNYDICMTSEEKGRLMTQLAQPYGLNLDDRNYLIQAAHILFVFQQDLFENLDYKSYSKEDVMNLGWTVKTIQEAPENFGFPTSYLLFTAETYQLFPLVAQLVEPDDSESEMVHKISYWAERNLMHYYVEHDKENPEFVPAYEEWLKESLLRPNFFRKNTAFYTWGNLYYGNGKEEMTMERVFKERLSGCHLSSTFLATLAKSIGIPAIKNRTEKGHSYTKFSRSDLFVHGDMIAMPMIWNPEMVVIESDMWQKDDHPYNWVYYDLEKKSRRNYIFRNVALNFEKNEEGELKWKVDFPQPLSSSIYYSPCMMTREEVMEYKEEMASALPEFNLVFTNDACRTRVDENGRFFPFLPGAHEDAVYRVTSEPIHIKTLDEYYADDYFKEKDEWHVVDEIR